ncbi:MAG: serine protease [Ectothiorhodospiraceae bacterium AqS1]|nr:serine protease [Ectothiorhodospiraceae bacterium AqS1]
MTDQSNDSQDPSPTPDPTPPKASSEEAGGEDAGGDQSTTPEVDLDALRAGIVGIRTEIPEDALTAQALGTDRAGSGAVIDDDGRVLTIGYLITEAERVWIIDHENKAVLGCVLGHDQETGFGLVQALQPISATTMTLGESATSKVGDRVIIAAHGSLGSNEIIAARIVAKREFAGYWEYLLDEAFFTAPAHTNWGGAAMVDLEGNLLGIGSLMVHTVSPEGEESGANMIVPIDPVKASIEDIKRLGVPDRIPRPWLGFIVQKTESDDLVVAGLYDDCPAAAAGLEIGDIIIDVAGKSVESLAELFRAIWNLGPAGCEVPLGIVRNGDLHRITLISIDRNARLKKSRVH